MTNKLVSNWWECKHIDNDLKWLSDSKGEDIWKIHRIEDKIVPGDVVLDVGVGTGRNVKDLCDKGMLVHGLDICQTPIDKIKPYTQKQYLGDDDLPKDTFNLAIAHLVTQHMNNDDLFKQLKNVIGSLKPTGIYSIQFLTKSNVVQLKQPDKVTDTFRGVDQFKTLVDLAGGKIVFISDKIKPCDKTWEQGMWWKVIHIKRI